MKYILVLALALIIIVSGCTQRIEIPGEMPQDFELYYSVGVGERNILDTRNNTYVHDMVCDPSIEYEMRLTESEKSEIYASVLENDLFNVKDDFTQNCNWLGYCSLMTPESGSTLTLTANGITKTIKRRGSYIHRNDPELERFENVEGVLLGIITRNKIEMNVTQPRCGYQ
jgi:hypothetical protein